MSQYIYKNHNDTIRVVIFDILHEDVVKEWNCDIWKRNDAEKHSVETYSEFAGDYFFSKTEAKSWATDQYGELTSIGPKKTPDSVIQGWSPLK